ncbi:exported hypothetical protein [Candidatus Zixiibacteriota bacterium]|nr:exported hypothetical protein [candidate division Zixibacteria bacterium]
MKYFLWSLAIFCAVSSSFAGDKTCEEKLADSSLIGRTITLRDLDGLTIKGKLLGFDSQNSTLLFASPIRGRGQDSAIGLREITSISYSRFGKFNGYGALLGMALGATVFGIASMDESGLQVISPGEMILTGAIFGFVVGAIFSPLIPTNEEIKCR